MDSRYESPDITAIWSDRGRNSTERQLWIAVMRIQRELGLDIPEDVIDMYNDLAQSQAALDPDSEDAQLEAHDIAELERETRHDLYARLRWFNEAVGADYAHRGLTSSDITENAQQVQIASSAGVLLEHTEQVLRRMAGLARGTSDVPIVARTHGRPAQLTTIGKRAADWMQELIGGMAQLQAAGDSYVLRGIKGAVGTRADLARTLLPTVLGDFADEDVASVLAAPAASAAASRLDRGLADRIVGGEPPSSMFSTGQCYPRSADLPIVSGALQVAAACGTFANAVRLMAVLGLVVENPQEHVGSSAMAHKSNPRYAERICSLQVVARGYAGMLQELAGSQWLEGDVSTSAARRIALPGLFHTVDAILANTAWILDHMDFDLGAIQNEIDMWMPEMGSGALLSALVEAGMPRAQAHALLRHHYGQLGRPDCESDRLGTLIYHLDQEPLCPLSHLGLVELFAPEALIGAAATIANTMADGMLGGMLGGVLADADPDWPGDLV